jgi:large subunit ribosomal protein L35
MPKMKTKSGAAKRLQVRGSGTLKRTTKNKRQLRGTTGVHKTNAKSVKAMLPYG